MTAQVSRTGLVTCASVSSVVDVTSTVGSPSAPNSSVIDWVRLKNGVVFTQDLDFETMLALTYSFGPGVLPVRGQNDPPGHMAPDVSAALNQDASDPENDAHGY